MAHIPGAVWKPLPTKYLSGLPMAAYNRVNLHVAGSLGSSLLNYFAAIKRPSSHGYVRKSGVLEQYVDTALRAEADLDGNDATISLETEGKASGSWTAAQCETIARTYAWAVREHGIARRLATDSKIGPSSHGLSWHRLGIDGNFPALPSILAGRRQRGGGMHYSTSTGKVCPGDARIRQIPAILARAEQILATVPVGHTIAVTGDLPTAPTGSVPDPLTPEDDMPYKDWPQADKDALARDVAAAVLGHKRPGDANRGPDVIDVGQQLADVFAVTTGVTPDKAKHPKDRASLTDIGGKPFEAVTTALAAGLAKVKATVDVTAIAAAVKAEVAKIKVTLG